MVNHHLLTTSRALDVQHMHTKSRESYILEIFFLDLQKTNPFVGQKLSEQTKMHTIEVFNFSGGSNEVEEKGNGGATQVEEQGQFIDQENQEDDHE